MRLEQCDERDWTPAEALAYALGRESMLAELLGWADEKSARARRAKHDALDRVFSGHANEDASDEQEA